MALNTPVQVASLNSTANAQAYSSSSGSPSANALLIAWFTLTDTVTPAPGAVANLPWGLTWTARGNVLHPDGLIRLRCFTAVTTSAPGADTFDVDASGGAGGNQTGCNIEVWEYTDGTGTAPSFVQVANDTGSGNPLHDTLAALGARAQVACCFTISRNPPDGTPDTGWTERIDAGHLSPSVGVWLIDSGGVTTDNSPSGTWATGNFAAIAVEMQAPAGGTTFTQAVAGAITPAGALARKPVKAGLAGAVAPAAVLARKTSRTGLAGAVTPVGALARALARLLGGAITPAGAASTHVTRRAQLAGGASPSGSLARRVSTLLAGAVSPAGALTRLLTRLLAGSTAPAGALARGPRKAVAGGVSPAGDLIARFVKLLAVAGGITPTGAVGRKAVKLLGGEVTPTGALTRAAARALAGAATPGGVLTRLLARQLAGQAAPVGAVARRTQVRAQGSVIPSGALRREPRNVLGGSLAPSGALIRRTSRALSGAVAPAGSLASLLISAGGAIIAEFLASAFGREQASDAVTGALGSQARGQE